MRPERWLYTMPLRIRSLFRRRRVDQELDEELEYHLERQIELNRRQGMDDDEARRAALRTMGGLDRRKEECRDARGIEGIVSLVHDARYGMRLFRRAPGFTAAVVLTVALGIGATVGMFSIVYGVMLQPLTFRHPERLCNLWSTVVDQGLSRAFVGAANARDWREQSRSFEDI